MSSDLANLENAELKEAFDAFDKVSLNWVNLDPCHGEWIERDDMFKPSSV